MRWFYVPLIFLLFWIGVPCGFYFGKIKPTNELWTAALSARNTARGAYGGGTEFTGLWPTSTEQEGLPKFQTGKDDKAAQDTAYEDKTTELEATLAEATARKDEHQAQLDAEVNAHMKGIRMDQFDYQKPDEFMYELLRVQRDEEGPHYIRWMEDHYKSLFFVFPIDIPAPPLTPYATPPVGPEGRLDWPVGTRGIPLTIYGPLNDICEFIDTFPDRYDRTAIFTGFQLTREAFDYRGHVLMRCDTTLNLYVWPKNAAPLVAEAPAAPAGGGAPAGAPAPIDMGGGGSVDGGNTAPPPGE